ncbi:intersectin-1 [Aplysia californica]|uniref:Intersectin-1 n=1 Tax=Aplysia californica TaxID=6500 RepID=A0ABM1VT80_APLCA|nr:intersectin-1 [Aplysia californica]
MAGSQDAWRVTGEDRAKHDDQFYTLKPVNGFVTGTQARDFFMQSGLATNILGQIWTLADMNGDGKMDRKEFSIAMHLIKKKLQGYELPKVLPASLKADPTPMMGSFAQPGMGGPMSPAMGMGFHMGGVPAPMGGGMGMPVVSMMQPQASLGTGTMTTGSLGMGPRMANGTAGGIQQVPGAMPVAGVAPTGVPGAPVAGQGGSKWAMPHNTKLKHTQTFNANDRNKRGYLLGVEARAILMQSGLPQQVLAQIWTLADIDRDGKLTCDEFCIAMHLSELGRMGITLPPTLPPELLPSKSRSGSVTSPPPASAQPTTPKKDAFTDLLGNAGMPQPVAPIPANAQPAEDLSIDDQVTFEDKRKENFDKGQAELERRRALLREQQKKEENERLEKERQEAEKRERQRLEAETRRQAEFQRQLEKQREKEREIEEQRRKMLEQREAARRELERQRQMEWERQRKEQLIAEKQREYEQLSILKSQMAKLKNELESLDAKKAELSLKITQVQGGVTDFTTSIDGMRVSRDRTLADIDLYERQSMELNKKSSGLNSEKDVLNVQVQTAQGTPLSDAHRTVMHSVDTKRTRIQQLNKEVEQLESDTEARLGEIDCNNAELKNMQEQISKLERDLPLLRKQQEEKITLQKKAAQEMQQKQKQERERQEKLKQEIEQQQRAKAAPAAAPAPAPAAAPAPAPAAAPAPAPASNADANWFDFNSSDAVSSAGGGTTSSSVNWDSAFSGTTTTAGSSIAWGSTNGSVASTGSQSKTKCKAIYDFTATREDELTLVAGMEVWVLNESEPVVGMEDWHRGESNGSVGWFPKAYVEKVEEPSGNVFGSAFEPVVQSSTSQKVETDLFSSSQFTQSSAISDSTSTASASPSSGTQIPPEGLLAKATYPWKARQEADLTFDKDDIILVKEQQDMKWYGELNEKSGWFPKAYVKLIGVASKSGLSAESSTPTQTKVPEPASVSPAPDTQGEYYIAMYTYTSDEPSDLTFSEGDMIFVTAASGDWWSGTIAEQGRSGIFPANYVKKLDIQLQPDKAPPNSTNSDSLFGDFGGNDPFGSDILSSASNQLDDPFAGAGLDPMGDPFASVSGTASSTNDMFSAVASPTSPMDDMFGSTTASAISPVDNLFASADPAPTSSSSSAFGSDLLSGFGDMSGAFGSTGSASLSTETKPTQSVSSAILSDGSDTTVSTATPMSENVSNLLSNLTLAKSEESSVTAVKSENPPDILGTTASGTELPAEEGGGEDRFAALSGLDWGDLGVDNSNDKPQGGLLDAIAPSPTTAASGVKKDEASGGVDAFSTSEDLFGGGDPFGKGGSALSNDDPFGKEMTTAVLEGFGATAEKENVHDNAPSDKPAPAPEGSDPFAGVLSAPVSQGDLKGSGVLGGVDFGLFDGLDQGTSQEKSSSKNDDLFSLDLVASPTSAKPPQSTSSLPDLVALEQDALQNNSLEIKLKDGIITKDNPALSSAAMESMTTQVDSGMGRTRSGSRRAPPPPVASAGTAPSAPDKNAGVSLNPEQKSTKKPEIARVIAPYVATGTGQLSLETGNLINVRQKSPRGWWEGELQVRGQKKKIGWFPANYVKLLGSASARSTPEPTAAGGLMVGSQGSRSATPQSIASQDGMQGINQQETVVALYAYTAQNDDELTFQKDAVITVLSRDNPDWWSGQLDGQTGVFPSNYVTPNPQSQSWMNDNVQEELSKLERKRQRVIQELISTEESYNSDMLIALEVFKKPLISGNVMPKEQVNQIFVNWEELIVCNKKLLQALRVRKKMCGKNGVIFIIGDILCESLPHMNPYMRFCSCQLSAAAALQRAAENSTAFQEFHKLCMQNPKVKGVHLSGYLLKPMQRITRYPLLIEKILSNTPTEHADRNNVEEALNLAQELCNQANQCVKEKQNSDSLEWIQSHVHCDGLAENIVFNSTTNCLGQRRLIFHGILYKAKSNKELIGFLFNDFLMLATTSRPLGTTFSTVHLFDTSTQFKMYRVPIFLNEVTVKKPVDDTDPTLFHITSDRIINLKAVSHVERDTWIREIEAASKQYKDKAKRKLERAHSVKRPSVGRILVVIQEACHLKASDQSGKSDPYCEVSMGSQEHRTKVIPGTLNPRWNASMQFLLRDVERDTLCFTVYDRDLYSPNDFLGRTEVRIKDVLDQSGDRRGPITKRLILHEVETGEVVVKLDLQLYEP